MKDSSNILRHVKSEDLIAYGFESEFVGRLPVRAVFERLAEKDLYEILKNPNNPIILGKKLDFAAYGIQLKFDDKALRILAKQASDENTGARGLVSSVEQALLVFENKLPSTDIKYFSAITEVVRNPDDALRSLLADPNDPRFLSEHKRLEAEEKEYVKEYIIKNRKHLSEKYGLTLTPSRVEAVSAFYNHHVMDIGNAIRKIKQYYDEIKKIELYFFKNHDINIVLEEDAVDYIIETLVGKSTNLDLFYQKLSKDFEYGLKLVLEKTGKNRFFISRKALMDPEGFLDSLIKNELSGRHLVS